MTPARRQPEIDAPFDWGLTAEQERRAETLHRDTIIFDMVSMYAGGNIFTHYSKALQDQFEARIRATRSRAEKIVVATHWPFEMALAGESNLIKDWLIGSGLTCGAFDIDLPNYVGGDPLDYGWDKAFSNICELPWMRRVEKACDVRAAKRQGQIGLYPFYQPVVPLGPDLRALDRAHERGLRALMLTYNRMDLVGVGCTERIDAGLSMYGIDVVERCNALGLMVDVSHCGRQTALDACRHSRAPVTANHSCARSLYPHPRAKSDDVLRAIAETGGVIGILAVPYFLSADRAATIEVLLDHIDYVVDRIGWRHVALGTDWPLQIPDWLLLQTYGDEAYAQQTAAAYGFWRDVTSRLRGFSDCRDFPNITRGLVARGYEDHEISGILGENALRVFETVCG